MTGMLRTWLVLVGLLAMPVLAVGAEPKPAAVLTVTKMCCEKESGPATKALYKIPGVSRVVVDHKARTLTIYSQRSVGPSPRAMWEVGEKLDINPTRLATTEGVYEKKPVR